MFATRERGRHVAFGVAAFAVVVSMPMVPSAKPGGAGGREQSGAAHQPVVEVIHGVKVVDRHRWLEDGDSAEVKAWTAAENARTRKALDAYPGRGALEKRLWQLFEIGALSAPVPRPIGTRRHTTWRYFYTRREGTQNQPILYVRDGVENSKRPEDPKRPDRQDRALVDVNALAPDGTRALDWWYPSEDGRLVAYGLSEDGSEESVLHVRDVQTGRDLPDAIDRTRAASIAWLPDGRGFFYTRYPQPGSVPAGEEKYHRRVFFHALGTDARLDREIFGRGRDLKDWPSVVLSPNGRHLVVQISEGWSKSELYLIDAKRALGAEPGATIAATPIAVGEDALFDVAELLDDALWVRTNLGAPRYRLVRIPLNVPKGGARRASAAAAAVSPPRSSWKTVIAESAHALEQVAIVGDRLAALYLEHATSRVRLFNLAGEERGEVALPGLGTVAGIHAHRRGPELFLPFVSFLTPTTVLRHDVSGAGSAAQRSASASNPTPAVAGKTSGDANPPHVWQALRAPVAGDAFVVEQQRVRSRDGTMLPMFVVHRRDLVPDGQRPAVLYGYGGFNVNMTPAWSASIIPFLEQGGVYAVAVLRGGGEYGEDWHRAGMLGRKQNAFDDFLAAAEHLVAAKWTNPNRLGISGRSNGGLLVGAALTQRPDLFRAVVCGVPLLDMIRYHRFRIAQLWIPEYGSPDDPDAFRWLYAYSPYHHVRDGVRYPAVLLSTAASDTRVDPLHARKMAARLQEATTSGRPVLLRLESQAGHGAGKPLGKTIAQLVDEWSFLFTQLDIPPPKPAAPKPAAAHPSDSP